MIHFALFGELWHTICGKKLGKDAPLYSENEQLVDCDKCLKTLGLDKIKHDQRR